MPSLIKRLDVIKDLVALEDTELLEMQAEHLRSMDITDGMSDTVMQIADCLEAQEYSRAIDHIETILSSQAALQQYEDPRIAALRMEARALEESLSELESEKAEIEREIHAFNLRHQQELGPIIEAILRIRKEAKQRAAEDAPADSEAQSEYEEARRKHEEYRSVVEEAKGEERLDLSEDEQAELKRLYRGASKKCHPDVVSEDEKDEAQALFVELKDAYERSDLAALQAIVRRLKSGGLTPRSASVSTIDRLEAEIERLQQRIDRVDEEIDVLRDSEEYQTLVSIANLNEYFANRKRRLQARLDDLRSELSASKA